MPFRRGGDIDGQQIGNHMLETFRNAGGSRVTGMVAVIETGNRYVLDVRSDHGTTRIEAERIVNAAGPFAPRIAAMLGVALPVHNTLRQKLASEDTARGVAALRTPPMPERLLKLSLACMVIRKAKQSANSALSGYPSRKSVRSSGLRT